MPFLRHLTTGQMRQLPTLESEEDNWAILGSAEDAWWSLPNAGLARCHATIVRSHVYHSHLLLELEGDVSVNGVPVVGFRVLRHRDQIQLSQEQFIFVEAVFESADQECKNEACVTCGMPFEEGEKIVRCPKCGDLYHHDCWLGLDVCGRGRECAYPVRGVVLEALAEAGVRSERVRPNDPLLAKHTMCPATERHDKPQPLVEGEDVVHCPECGTVFHEKCWLVMDRCSGSGCHFNIQSHLSCTFSANPAPPEEEIVQCPECTLRYQRSVWITLRHCVNADCLAENPDWRESAEAQPGEES
jgi:uncharacterized C2H2 Zn-finger protein